MRIVGEHRTSTTIQMEIEHLEGPRAGQRVKVGLRRLKGPWSGVEAFDSHDRKLRDLERSHHATHRTDYSAAAVVIAAAVPAHVMEGLSWPGRGVVVHDQEALSALCGVPATELVREDDSIEADDGLLVGADTMVRVARAICTAHPEAMRKELLKRERRLLLAPHSREVRAAVPENDVTGVLHDWCGTQPSEIRLRLIALENELSWQRSLVREAMEMLRACGVGALADNLASLSRQGPREREHDEYACACADEREPPYAGREEYADSFPW
ncbi:MAG: hypothetical protein EOL89_09935 [Actinobacteria bacterium]|nr:hypothetical protein [Actinomycetota bacterium]